MWSEFKAFLLEEYGLDDVNGMIDWVGPMLDAASARVSSDVARLTYAAWR